MEFGRVHRKSVAVDDRQFLIAPKTTSRQTRKPVIVKVPFDDRVVDRSSFSALAYSTRSSKSDLSLVSADGKTVKCQKAVLSNMSLRFQRFLRETPEFRDSSDRVFPKLTGGTLTTIYSFLVTGSIKLSVNNIQRLYVGAVYLGIPCLVAACCKFLNERMLEVADVILHLTCRIEHVQRRTEQPQRLPRRSPANLVPRMAHFKSHIIEPTAPSRSA